MRVYLDANVIIYLIEGEPGIRAAAMKRIAEIDAQVGSVIITSRLSRLECRVKPLRGGDLPLLAIYDTLFGHNRVHLTDITAPIVERATDLRARYGFRTPDAVHLATAIEARADLFLTGDEALTRCRELRVETLHV